MSAVTVTVQYEAGHASQETWVHVPEMFCPRCSARTVWMHDDGGDYYVGEQYLCRSCTATFTIQGPSDAEGWQNEQRLAGLR